MPVGCACRVQAAFWLAQQYFLCQHCPSPCPSGSGADFKLAYRMVYFYHVYGRSGQMKYVPGWLMLPETVQLGRISEVNGRVLGGHVSLTAPKQSQGKDSSTLNVEGVILTLTNQSSAKCLEVSYLLFTNKSQTPYNLFNHSYEFTEQAEDGSSVIHESTM